MTDFYTITINGVDLLVDAEDADFMERYQSAYNELAAKPPASIESDPSSATVFPTTIVAFSQSSSKVTLTVFFVPLDLKSPEYVMQSVVSPLLDGTTVLPNLS